MAPHYSTGTIVTIISGAFAVLLSISVIFQSGEITGKISMSKSAATKNDKITQLKSDNEKQFGEIQSLKQQLAQNIPDDNVLSKQLTGAKNMIQGLQKEITGLKQLNLKDQKHIAKRHAENEKLKAKIKRLEEADTSPPRSNPPVIEECDIRQIMDVLSTVVMPDTCLISAKNKTPMTKCDFSKFIHLPENCTIIGIEKNAKGEISKVALK